MPIQIAESEELGRLKEQEVEEAMVEGRQSGDYTSEVQIDNLINYEKYR